jgi:hypothetical protein
MNDFRYVIQTVTEKNTGQYTGDFTMTEILAKVAEMYQACGDDIIHIGITRMRKGSVDTQH